MTTYRELLQRALEAWDDPVGMPKLCKVMAALRARLAEPVQCNDNDSPWLVCKKCREAGRCEREPDDTTRCWYCRHEYPGAALKCPACGSLTQKFVTKPKNDDTEARVRRVMGVAHRFADARHDWYRQAASDRELNAARAELERVVRECVR